MSNEELIISEAAESLKSLTGMGEITFRRSQTLLYDYDLCIGGTDFACEVKRSLSKANFNLVLNRMEVIRRQTDKPLLIVANHFTPELFEKFPKEGISVADSSGNCAISAGSLFIRIGGQKTSAPKEASGKAFKEAGLKLIFYFLLDSYNINKPYRKISEETGLSLGSIKNVIEELSLKNFVGFSEKGRFLCNKKELLDLWQTHYNSSLKPKLFIRDMDFADKNAEKHWQDIGLPENMCWGGEGGAYLLDNFLVPQTFDIYSDAATVELLKTGKVRLSENGSIKLYRKFWNYGDNSEIAPKILVYADLMGSGNGRCIEAAQRLIENGI